MQDGSKRVGLGIAGAVTVLVVFSLLMVAQSDNGTPVSTKESEWYPHNINVTIEGTEDTVYHWLEKIWDDLWEEDSGATPKQRQTISRQILEASRLDCCRDEAGPKEEIRNACREAYQAAKARDWPACGERLTFLISRAESLTDPTFQ